MARLLVIACSDRKRPDRTPLPAIDRYDGPTFRVLRKYLRDQPNTGVAVYILSAEFGLICGDKRIPDYDRKMTRERVTELISPVHMSLRHVISKQSWSAVGICLGREYLAAIDDLLKNIAVTHRVTMLGGGLGKRLTALRNWLQECPNGND